MRRVPYLGVAQTISNELLLMIPPSDAGLAPERFLKRGPVGTVRTAAG